MLYISPINSKGAVKKNELRGKDYDYSNCDKTH